MKIIVNFTLEPETKKQIAELAWKKRTTLSQLLRKITEDYLEKHQQKSSQEHSYVHNSESMLAEQGVSRGALSEN